MTIWMEAARDLLDHYKAFQIESVPELIEHLRDALPLIQQIDTQNGEKHCLNALATKISRESIEYSMIPRVIRELCHYLPEQRGAILDTAIAFVTPVADARKALAGIQADVFAALQRLDPRIKALLVVLEELRFTETNADTQFCDLIDELDVDDTAIARLRTDPKLASIMKAYDLARVRVAENEMP